MLALGASVLPAGARGAFAAPSDRGRQLYAAKCAKCHKLRDPNDYDEATWNAWMEKMRKKARLKDDDYRLVSEYAETLRRKP